MKVRVRLFAVARQLEGDEQLIVELPETANVGQLRDAICKQFPALAALVPHLMIAVDKDYAADSITVTSESQIACIPPVSGG